VGAASRKDGSRHMKAKFNSSVLTTFLFMLQVQGQYIEWEQLLDLRRKLADMSLSSRGLSLVPKLKRELLKLTSFSRMRVDLAAQVCYI
jgi:hypothetical protein